MAGHNKWSKIKHKKAVTDAKKSKVFSKYAKLIAVESKRAGGDTSDPGLRAIIDKAKSESMPKDNIDRAVARGTSKDADSLEAITYEFFGPAGIAFIVEVLTDNRNRTGQEIKHMLSKRDLTLGGPNATSWAFQKDGVRWTPLNTVPVVDQDIETFESLVEELDDHDDVQEVYTNAEGYQS